VPLSLTIIRAVRGWRWAPRSPSLRAAARGTCRRRGLGNRRCSRCHRQHLGVVFREVQPDVHADTAGLRDSVAGLFGGVGTIEVLWSAGWMWQLWSTHRHHDERDRRRPDANWSGSGL